MGCIRMLIPFHFYPVIYSSYNLDSHFCRAEQLWNVTAEAGFKTLVFQWPGCSWPPTSDSPNLHVVDGFSPGVVNMSYAQVEQEFVLMANKETTETAFRRKCASDTKIPCVITDLGETRTSLVETANGLGENKAKLGAAQRKGLHKSVNLTEHDGERGLSANPFDVVLTWLTLAWYDKTTQKTTTANLAVAQGKTYFQQKLTEMGKMSRDEKKGLGALLFCMVYMLTQLWHGYESVYGSVLPVIFLYLPGIKVGNANDMSKIPWTSSIGIVMGFLAVGTIGESIGVNTLLAQLLLPFMAPMGEY